MQMEIHLSQSLGTLIVSRNNSEHGPVAGSLSAPTHTVCLDVRGPAGRCTPGLKVIQDLCFVLFSAESLGSENH